MDLTKRHVPLGQETGKTFADNYKEAVRLMQMLAMPEMNPRIYDNLTIKDLGFVKDLYAKMQEQSFGASVTGKQLFRLRDIKDRMVERGII